MTGLHRRAVLAGGLCAAACTLRADPLRAQPAIPYVCPPCGCAADGRIFDRPGTCPVCGMRLVPQDPAAAAAALPFEPAEIPAGTGAFTLRGGLGREDKRIVVHYHRPAGFAPDSPVLLVIPGAGRDGDEYRDAWIEPAERHGLLVAAPTYAEVDYDFAAYHLGGIVRDLELRNLPAGPDGELPASLYLRDEDIVFTPEPRPEAWLFADFDRIFAQLVRATGSRRTHYDLFGHSAGGQILHRLVLFRPRSRANRILAANAGFYTLPDFATPLPFGLRGTPINPASLRAAFANRLTVLLGALDNHPDRGGQHLHTPLADRQGLHRLARGRYFHEIGRRQAARLRTAFNWRLEIAPWVGHDHRGMGRAAARLLYGRG
jgi:hypothetical protein